MIPLILQNRIYHFWVYRSRITLQKIEDHWYENLEEPKPPRDILLTYSVSQSEQEVKGYWHTIIHSKLFWLDVLMFTGIFLIALLFMRVFNQIPISPGS